MKHKLYTNEDKIDFCINLIDKYKSVSVANMVLQDMIDCFEPGSGSHRRDLMYTQKILTGDYTGLTFNEDAKSKINILERMK